jgi:hypothetical protein
MKTRIGILVVTFFATLPFYWERTSEAGQRAFANTEDVDEILPPLVLSTSLYDSLPGTVVDMLGLSGVEGTKIKYRSGLYASYYRYSVDRQKLLGAFTLMAVPIRDNIADTSYRLLTRAELQSVSNTLPLSEFAYDEGFWSAALDQFEVLESIKPPFRHIVLVSKVEGTVFHRVAPLI